MIDPNGADATSYSGAEAQNLFAKLQNASAGGVFVNGKFRDYSDVSKQIMAVVMLGASGCSITNEYMDASGSSFAGSTMGSIGSPGGDGQIVTGAGSSTTPVVIGEVLVTPNPYGYLNLMQAAALDIGRNDYQRWKANNFAKIVVGWTGIGAAAPFAVAGGMSLAPAAVASFLGNPVAWTEGVGALTMGAAGYEGEFSFGAKSVNPSTLIRTERGISWNASTEIVADYMKSGITKPIDVFKYGSKAYIIDGHHRVEAALRLGENVPVNYLPAPRNYSSVFELQDAAHRASFGGFKVDGRYLNTLLGNRKL